VAEVNRLHYVEPTLVDGILQIPKEIRETGTERWQHCLVGQFLDSSPTLAVVQGWENRLWGRKESITVSKFGEKLYLFQISSAETCTWIFEGGPWHLRNNVLFLQYYSELGLSRISSLLGIPLWMDRATRCGSQLGFAKICVEISSKSAFPVMISFLSDEGILFDVEVEYCNAPSVCSSCSKFGHKSCAKKAEVKEDPQIPKSDAKAKVQSKMMRVFRK
ncbi:hypothetical protein LINPERPRIM_LOCUS22617, partial [Linum perenne]